MKKPWKFLLVPAAFFVAVTAGVSSAFSQTPTPTPTPDSVSTPSQDGNQTSVSYDKMLADELNISVNDLREAQANARSQFYRALADEGTLTDEQAAALESASIADIIHSAVGESDDNVVVDHILSKVAGALDMSTAELRDKLENGENLDQIAKDADVSESDLESKATDAISEIISNAEDAGLLSADEADKIREDLDQRVREFIGRTVGGSVTPPPTATPTPSN